ncbi:MAG: hypothetical protein HYZ73_04400 [Elusimicrobia bacterium]|nr:hypothetical protein [Elusimicrobiota bacterium]
MRRLGRGPGEAARASRAVPVRGANRRSIATGKPSAVTVILHGPVLTLRQRNVARREPRSERWLLF